MSERVLIVIDMQNDFIDAALGTKEAVAIVDDVKKKIEEYVRNQMQQDLEYDQMSLKEYIDPFTGEPVNKA